ncbi:MAG TPA: bifunctional DNA primase/polymerase, partial [Methanosarcina sp.]|nr:bifunctional DNA primase/polymerase [Methanosarcina sp.]
MNNFKQEIYNAALQYTNNGWLVFPLHSIDDKGICTCGIEACTDAGKHPRGQRGLKEASKDRDKIDSWFGESSPLSNIAIVTGEVSDITVLDIDIGEGKKGAESWAEAIAGHGEPDTLSATTGSGGLHFIFRYNSALKTSGN